MAARKSTKKNQTESAHLPVPVASDGAPERAAAPEPARLVIVDAANGADPAPDGSAAHPYARIQDAADAAGENAVIYARSGIYREAVALKPGQHLTSVLELGGPLAGRTWAEPSPPVIELHLPRAIQAGCKDIPRAALLLPEGASARRIGITLWAQGGEDLYDDEAVEAQTALLVDAFLGGQGLSAEMLPEEKLDTLRAAMRQKVAESPSRQRLQLLAEARDLRGLRGGAAAVLALPGRGGGDGEIEVRDCKIEVSGGHMGIALVVPRFRSLRSFTARGNDVRVDHGDGVAAFLGKGARASLGIGDNSVAAEGDGARALRLALPDAGAKLEARIADNRLATGGDGADALHLMVSGAGSEFSGEIAGNRIRTRGAQSSGVEIQPREGGLVRALLVRGNDIATAGDRAKGVNLWTNDKGGQEVVHVRDNAIVTSGALAPALIAQCDEGGRVPKLSAENNDLSVEGFMSKVAFVAVNRNAALGELDFRGNRLLAGDDRACGVTLHLESGSRTGRLALAENRIACAGLAGHGIELTADEDATPTEPPYIRDNEIETKGAEAHGLSLRGRGVALAGLLEVRTGNVFRISGEGGLEMFFHEDDGGKAPEPKLENEAPEDFQLPEEI